MSGMDAFAPDEIPTHVETRGVAKAGAPFLAAFGLGVLAGAFIALGAMLSMIGTAIGGAVLVGLVFWFVYLRPKQGSP